MLVASAASGWADTLYETSSGYGKIKMGATTLARHT
jgi:hypothetical protein